MIKSGFIRSKTHSEKADHHQSPWPWLAIIAALSVLAVASCSASPKSYADDKAKIPRVVVGTISDGSYEGSAFKFPVKVRVRVEVAGGTIARITLLQHFNGQGKPAEAIIPKVIAAQDLDVDVISGATHSSIVILKAIADALSRGGPK